MNLNGLNGIVYLMFLGRETYARAVAQKLLMLEFIEDEDTIYPIIKKLKNAEFIKEIKTLVKKPGTPVICTGIFEPLFILFKVVKPKMIQEDFERIKGYIQRTGDAIHFLPDYIRMTYDISRYDVKKLNWYMIASTYLDFLLGSLIFSNPEEELDTETFTKVVNEIFDTEIGQGHFFPMKKIIENLSNGFYDKISKKHYQDDVLLIAELSNLILYGPRYKFLKKTIGFAVRTKLDSYTNNISNNC